MFVCGVQWMHSLLSTKVLESITQGFSTGGMEILVRTNGEVSFVKDLWV